MSTQDYYVLTFGTPIALPFKLRPDEDGNFQNLLGVTVTIQWENEKDGTSGEFIGATLTLLSTTTNYQRYKVTYTPAAGDFGTISETQRYNLKIRLTKSGLKKEIGTYKAQVIEF
jgi:hypothetical protein